MRAWLLMSTIFFFQAEDGIRDVAVTGVQTCALPIFCPVSQPRANGKTRTEATAGGERASDDRTGGERRERGAGQAQAPIVGARDGRGHGSAALGGEPPEAMRAAPDAVRAVEV